VSVDVVVVGGGAAGLWLLNVLEGAGYRAVLLEAERLGAGQSLMSQGMIHGGLKYALGGALTGASEAAAAMPARWRACLAGTGPVDLTGLAPVCDHNVLFADATAFGKLRAFFASRALAGRIRKLAPAAWPEALAGSPSTVYALDDLVLDTEALLRHLHERVAALAYRHRLEARHIQLAEREVRITAGRLRLRATCLVLAAGSGNAALLEALGVREPAMQCRPLRQALVRAPGLPPLFGHCLTGMRRAEPRLTISSHRDGAGWLWYVGGQLASDGVGMEKGEFVAHTRAELAACLPGLDFTRARIDAVDAIRAEPAHGGARPDRAFAECVGALVVCWPVKLSLLPDLGDRVLSLLAPPPRPAAAIPELPLPRAAMGLPPWARGEAT